MSKLLNNTTNISGQNNFLLSEYKINKYFTLKNRIVMAPMTRAFATDSYIPTEQMADYYARRSGAGLIITEGTIISSDARGQNNVPGIFDQFQVEGWQKVVDKVHDNNGLIFNQLWHVGRVSHPVFLNGKLPVSPSATMMTSKIKRSIDLHYGASRAMTLNDIKHVIENYRNAAVNAIKAGFDGIEIHGANGYLIDQFLHYCTNLRADDYGGSPQNMARFALEVIKNCGDAIGFERVALRLSPGAYLNEIVGEAADAAVFQYLLQQLNNYSIAYVHTGNFDDSRRFVELNSLTMTEFIRKYYSGCVIACGGYDVSRAESGIQNGLFDLVAFGRPFIANHDLVEKIYQNKTVDEYTEKMLSNIW